MSDEAVKTEIVDTPHISALDNPFAGTGDEEVDEDSKKAKPSAAVKKSGKSASKLRAAAAAAAAASKTKAKPVGGAGAVSGERKKKKSPVTHPRTLDMVVEALKDLRDSRGSSVQAIRTWILANYKTVRADMIKVMLKRALPQGLDEGLLVRPKKQTETQLMCGRYRVGAGDKRETSPPVIEKKKVQPTRAKPKIETKKLSVKAKTKSKKKEPVPVKSVKSLPKSSSKSRSVPTVVSPPTTTSSPSSKKSSSPKSGKKVVAAAAVISTPAKKSHKKKDKKRESSSSSKSSKKKSPKKKSSRK